MRLIHTLRKPSSRGFSLLEILIVLALITGILTITIPRLRPKDRVLSSLRKVTVLTRKAYGTARLKGRTYRLVVFMPNEESETQEGAIWMESTEKKGIVQSTYKEELEQEKEGKDNGGGYSPDYTMDTKILKEKITLPPDYKFESVEIGEELITEGKAYIYFLPQGRVTQAAIHVSSVDFDNSNQWTIITHPLTGQSRLVAEKVSAKDLFQ